MFVSFFLLLHCHSHQLLSPSICSSQFSSLRFLLQTQVHSFLFINFFFYFFFSHLPSSPRFHSQGMKNFQYSHFGPAKMELYSKHWSTPCQSYVGEANKKKKPLGHRSPVSLTDIDFRQVSDSGTLPKMACRCNLDDNPHNKSSLIARKHGCGWEGAAPEFDAAQCSCPRVNATFELFFFFLGFAPTQLDSRRLGFDSHQTSLISLESGRISHIKSYQPVTETAEIGLQKKRNQLQVEKEVIAGTTQP